MNNFHVMTTKNTYYQHRVCAQGARQSGLINSQLDIPGISCKSFKYIHLTLFYTALSSLLLRNPLIFLLKFGLTPPTRALYGHSVLERFGFVTFYRKILIQTLAS